MCSRERAAVPLAVAILVAGCTAPAPMPAPTPTPIASNDGTPFAGGYWVDSPRCITLIIRARGQQANAHIAVGAPCRE